MTLELLREETGLSRKEVADKVGMTPHGIRKIELGGDTLVSTLERYARALNVDFVVVWRAHKRTRDERAATLIGVVNVVTDSSIPA